MPTPESASVGPVPVIVNHRGGTAAALGDTLRNRLRDAFAAAGVDADIRLVDGCDVADEVRRCASAPLVVVGGGDGTLGSAAYARVESGGGALGLLPLGTRNHLAHELGIPDGLDEAAALIAAGHTRAIDLATVNDVGFVNNASIGFYPLMVRWRDAERERRNLPKWLATVPAVWATLRRLRHHRLRLAAEGRARPVTTPLLFVGNNHYELERGRVGKRVALDDGLLSVFAVSTHSRVGMVWFAVRTLAGRSDPERDFAALGDVPALTVHSRAGHVHVAVDGEVHRLVPPLRFAVRPGALTVVVPQQPRAEEAARA